ncbi:MAG: FAD binding domain-containing protein [Xanthobacteraceae bacterium]
MKPAPFSYHAPTELQEALKLLAALAPQDGRILAGGQTLVPTMAFRMARPAHLIDINGIRALDGVVIDGDRLRIGACTRHAYFESDKIPGRLGDLLRKVVRFIAHYPIRQRGTFCGSVANADPASEWCCVTAALDGVVVAESERGVRRIAAKDFYKAVMTTDISEDELITAVELPLLQDDTRTGFGEFSRRAGDFAIAMVLATYRLQAGRIADARIGLGGAEAFPRRIKDAEARLIGQKPEPVVFAAAADAAAAAIDPIEDNNNSADYRRALVRTLVCRALASAR